MQLYYEAQTYFFVLIIFSLKVKLFLIQYFIILSIYDKFPLFDSMLAYNGVGWGGMPPNKVISDLGLEIGAGHAFQFPPDSTYDSRVSSGADIGNDTSNIKTQRSISAPNVSHTIINPESILTEYGNKFGKIPKDHVRSKY